jgi:hypothetical protein
MRRGVLAFGHEFHVVFQDESFPGHFEQETGNMAPNKKPHQISPMLESQRNRPDEHERYRFDTRGVSGRTSQVPVKGGAQVLEESPRPSFFARVQEFHAARSTRETKA